MSRLFVPIVRLFYDSSPSLSRLAFADTLLAIPTGCRVPGRPGANPTQASVCGQVATTPRDYRIFSRPRCRSLVRRSSRLSHRVRDARSTIFRPFLGVFRAVLSVGCDPGLDGVWGGAATLWWAGTSTRNSPTQIRNA